jgi:uncharacterized membrane protein YqjE
MFEKIASAAPLLARHASAYGELLADDLLTASQAFGRRLLVSVILIMAILMTLLLACAWLIAFTWDTPERLLTIGALTGVFFLGSLAAGYGVYSLQTKPMHLLTLTRQELVKDRQLVEDLVPKAPEKAA